MAVEMQSPSDGGGVKRRGRGSGEPVGICREDFEPPAEQRRGNKELDPGNEGSIQCRGANPTPLNLQHQKVYLKPRILAAPGLGL